MRSLASSKWWLLVAGVALALALVALMRSRPIDGTINDVATYEMRAVELPATVQVPVGEVILDGVRHDKGEIVFACRFRVQAHPALSGVAIPSKYSRFPPPTLTDENGRKGKFRRDPDAIDKLLPNTTVVRDYETDADGYCEYPFECRFDPPPGKELTLTLPGHYLLTRETHKHPFTAHDGFQVVIRWQAGR